MALEARLLAPARPLRVVHMAGGIGPNPANGVGRAVYYLSEAQRALGHDVSVVSERSAHMKGHSGDRSALVPAMNRLARITRQVSPTLTRELLALRPDIVHMHSVHVPENVSLAKYLRRAKVPYCVTVHGGLCGMAQRRGLVKKRVLWWMGEHEYFNGALFVHALTPEEADDLRAYGVKGRTVIAPNGIDADTVPQATDPHALYALAPELIGHRVFMFMGRLAVVQKGLDLLIQGFSLAGLPRSRLVLLGPDWRSGRASLERQVARLGLRSQVLFLDCETPHRCADLVAGADVFVHPSRWEGMPLAVLEAAVWQKPCLLTRPADPNGAIVRAGGGVMVDATPADIAQGLRLLSNLDRRQLVAMGARARSAVVSSFKWRPTAHTLLEAYRCDAQIG